MNRCSVRGQDMNLRMCNNSEYPDDPTLDLDSQYPGMTYEEWWESFDLDDEPHYYALYNHKMEPSAACWLFFTDHVFFPDGAIVWDGKHHSVTQMDINNKNMDEIPLFMKHVQNFAQGVADFVLRIEQDEGLVVPREKIHKITQRALPKGDLTGLTLFNLQACERSLMIIQLDPHKFRVCADSRVFEGIPDFVNLVGRMIWTMREISDIEAPFSVLFTVKDNPAADSIFKISGSLDSPVPNVSKLGLIEFKTKPVVDFSEKNSINEKDQASSRYNDVTLNKQYSLAKDEVFCTALGVLVRDAPWDCEIDVEAKSRCFAKKLKRGDELRIESKWDTAEYKICNIAVCDKSGKLLGFIKESLTPYSDSSRELACVLPFVTAAVKAVMFDGSKILIDINIDSSSLLSDEEWITDKVVEEAVGYLNAPKDNKSLIS